MRHSNGRGLMLAMVIFALGSAVEAADPVFVRGGRLFDGTGETLIDNPGVLVVGGVFHAIGTPDALPDGTQIVELAATNTIMPGIFDLHAHHNIRVLGMGRIDETRTYPLIYLANGVTSVFPAGEYNPDDMLEMRRRIDRGEQIGPRVMNSGPYYGISMRRKATIEEVYERVDHWAELGAQGFKAKLIGPDQLRALIDRAHRHGLPVTAHLDSGFRNSVNPRDAIAMGIDRIEHFLGGDLLPDERSAYASLQHLGPDDFDSPAFDAIVQAFIEHGVTFDATMTAYGYFGTVDPDVYEQWTDESRFLSPRIQAWAAEQPEPEGMEQFVRIYNVKKESLRRFYEAGGTISLGTDHVCDGRFLAGFAAHREMHAMANVGIPTHAVLRIATINGARAMNVGDKLGTIEAGKYADLVVVDGDPLEDIRNTRNVRLVMKAGTVYDAADLLAQAEGRLGSGSPWDDE